ncbi:hypothetical protein FOPG_15423 [Fusarium oxysporum f. sp. conglutinans race 2 54008]|nr:hypothetical protein FOPG_15423 [Fusarium oxysporum f. sp. conglutinans race 2 54008]
MSVSYAANLSKDPITFGDMSNLTRITANFAVAFAQRDSIAPTYYIDMSQLTPATLLDLVRRGELTVLPKLAALAYEPKPNSSLGLMYPNPSSQERQSRSSEVRLESRTLYQQEVVSLNQGRELIANDTNFESRSATIGGVCTAPSIFEDVDFSWFDFGLLDLTMDPFGDMTNADAAAAAHNRTSEDPNSTLTSNWPLSSSFSTRSEAYQRSPWTGWQPAKFHGSFHGQDVINLGAGSSRERTTLWMKASTAPRMGSTLDGACRDRLLVLVTAMKISRFSIHSFPPAELLNELVRFSFIQESVSLVPSIHPGTFSCYHVRPELLLGVIASGAVSLPERRIQVTGLLIQELLRTAIAQLFETDNSATRDLQALQAYMRALEVGVWSGLKRKTEIACSFMQPEYTMLFEAGAFSPPPDQKPAQSIYQSADELDRGWRTWAIKESFTHLAIRGFIHDSQVSMAFFKPPTISYAELNMPIPYPRRLWFAKDAKKWRQELLPFDNGVQRLLLTEVLADVTVLERCSDKADLQICCFAAIHALANQVWDLQQQFALLVSAPEAKRRRIYSWCISRQRDLYEDLMTTRMYCKRHAAHHEISLMLEYVMMALHAPIANVQRFAGKEGESEARRVAPTVGEWSQSSSAQVAIWHAGQVLRTARRFPPSTLQNFYAVAIYHAALVLWAYSILSNRTLSHAEGMIPDGISHSMRVDSSSATLVMLDGEDNDDALAFRTLGHGTPGLSDPAHSGTFCPVGDPALTMQLSADTLRGNLLSTDPTPPLLVCNIISLMKDLSSSLGCAGTGGNSSADNAG